MTAMNKSAWVRIIRSIALPASVFSVLALAGVTAAQAAAVTLRVVSARTEPAHTPPVVKGAAITTYKYLVNIDNTGQTTQRSPAPGTGCSPQDAGYPNSCLWTSIAGAASHSPVYTQGTQANVITALANVPNGRYLISVLADGYKLDGRHFTVNGGTVTWEGKAAGAPASEVLVELQPTPLPDAQIQAAVFEDVSPVNSAPDLPAEHGLAGFQGHILDVLGEVTTNVYGAPLCEIGRCLSACYVVSNGLDVGTVQPVDAAGRCPTTLPATALMSTCAGKAPFLVTVNPSGGPNDFNTFQCPAALAVNVTTTVLPAGAVIEGKVKIPNLGPNRYTLSVTPPDGSGWVQTTTLEGNHDWDAWVMEGATGLDTEFTIAGEPFPAIIFGYVPVPGTPSAVGSALAPLTGTGTIKGVVDAVKIYVPTTGGVAGLPGQIWGGLQGARIDKPIPYPWVTLTNLGNGDTIVWAGKGDANGKFEIPNVPAGTYTLTWWDEPQNTILDLVNVTVGTGETVDMGILPLTGWWTFFDGYVFDDANRNGIKDPGEVGLPGYTLTMRRRENTLMDRGSTVVRTDANGYYKFEAGYPMTQWLVMEAYDDLHYTTGITYQADNQPTPTTVIGAGVDVSVHPIIGLGGRLDWGKHNYDPTGTNGIDPRNGGIVGTVSYDTTRNETDPRYAAIEDWQPSISDLVVKLYKPLSATLPCVRQPALNATCDPTGRYALAVDGSIAKGQLLNTYLTETWQRPSGCVARGLDGTPFIHGTDEQVLPTDDSKECIEAPLMGVQFAPYAADQGTPAANFGAAVNGNYGFGDGCFISVQPIVPGEFNPATGLCTTGTLQALPAGDYLVQVDLTSLPDSLGNPIYKVTREEDINIGNGDQFIPPAALPSACAGALHVVNSTGNATFPGGPGTSPYEGQNKPLCDVKLVRLDNGKSIAPAFNIFTDVPLPGRHWFIAIDDLNFSSNPKSVTYGEKAGMPFVPVGIYDWTDRLIKTVETDYNGLADVLLPSTNRINCPTPSGVCANLYRYVGNDPGVPGRLNLNYNPSYRTIAAEFEVLPGQIIPADLAPTQVGVTVQLPGAQTTSPVMCRLDDATPQLYAVSRPYIGPGNGAAARTFTIRGSGFGTTAGQVLLDGTALPSGVAWGANQITVVVPQATANAVGPKQLQVVAANGQSTVNGLTLHVLGTGYNPQLFEVGPTVVDSSIPAARHFTPQETLPAAADHAIQKALDAAAAFVDNPNNREALVVVYPNNPSANPRQNPRGAYYENLIITSRVKLQGVGPGSPDGSVRGTIVDGGAFAGDSPVATDWYTRIALETTVNPATGNATPNWGGNATIYDGAVISVYVPTPTGGTVASQRKAFPTVYSAATAPSIDGFDLRGGNQQGFPGNINVIGGGVTGLPGGLITQGGAIFANAYARNLQITNNVVQNNGGAYGTIRIGTPDLPAPNASSHNEGVVIAHNRVVTNAGTNQAGGIGLFAGSDNYQVVSNDICGNFSSEYGGGVSHVGLSPNGSIRYNRIYFNRSFDEGGGIMIAGALPATTTLLSPGAGPVNIYNNLIQANLANDDGGGIRFLMAGNFPMNVYNNFIVNNISTHEGGGIALNDAPNVRVFNNTIMKNLTTATAITSNGAAAPAGLSTSMNSALLQATLPVGSLAYSNPLLFNNIFWDNRAGTRTLSQVTGLTAPIDNWDVGVADGPALLAPTNSVLQSNRGITASPTNVIGVDPAVIAPYDVGVTFNTWRNNPAFLGAILISADLPPNLMGNYHLGTGSPAINRGAANKSGVNAPPLDIDNEVRTTAPDAGADEFSAAALPRADLSITKTDGVTSVTAGAAVSYTIVVSNAGPAAVTGATVQDTVPAALTGVTWNCAATAGSACVATSGSGNINTTVNLQNGGSATFTLNATVAANATGTLANTATVTAPSSAIDPNPANNSATDSDTIALALPAIGLLDNFTRANATTLGTNWSQTTTIGTVIRLNGNQAQCALLGNCVLGAAMWNGATNVFGATQGAAFTFTSTPAASLYLKASGGAANAPASFIRVRPNGATVVVETTTNSGGAFITTGTLAGANFASGDRLSARANADGSVDVWKTTAANVTTYLGRSAASAFTGGGRIGMQMLVSGTVDNFSGGTLP